jgi:hypothetical protein
MIPKPTFAQLLCCLALIAILTSSGYTAVAQAPGDKICTYTEYSDEREWDNTQKILGEGFPEFQARMVELTEPGDLGKCLASASILFIPEQENIDIDPQVRQGRSWAETLKAFLERGGRIVGLWDSAFYFLGARLSTAEPVDNIDPATLSVVDPAHPLVQGVSASFAGEDLTVFFGRVDGKAIVKQKDRDRTVVFTKNVGAGSITLLGFDYFEFNQDMARILVNALGATTLASNCSGSVELKPNEFLKGQKIEAKAATESKEKQFCILVGANARLLAVRLESKGNVDMHIRSGRPVERAAKALASDFAFVSPKGDEFAIIFAPILKPGPYFIAIENKEDTAQEYTIIAAPIAELQTLKPGEPTSGTIDPNAGLLPVLRQYLETKTGLLGLTQYCLAIPKDAKSIRIQLLGPKDKNLDLHLRYGKPAEIRPDGRVEADLSLIAPTGEEGIELAGSFLKAGETICLAVESLVNEKVDFKVLVTVDLGTKTLIWTY